LEPYERQQFDFLLMTAIERFQERLVQRNQGYEKALEGLRNDPNGEGIWLDRYVEAILSEFLLDNMEGASFILRALPRRPLPALEAGSVQEVTVQAARHVFTELLKAKTEEFLEQTMSYS
jgi:hypothetical protein